LFDEIKFKKAIEESGYTLSDIAVMLDIDLSTLYRKMHGESDFYRREIDIIVENLKIKNPSKIFFA